MLEVSGLTRSYGGVLAVRDVTFAASPGQVIGLLGPNGSGKTTTIRMLTGLIRPTAGTVTWRGIDIQQRMLEYQSTLGYVPEEPKLYAYLTAPEYLARGRASRHPARDAESAHRSLPRTVPSRHGSIRSALIVLERDAAEGASLGRSPS